MRSAAKNLLRLLAIIFLVFTFYFGFWGKWKLAIAMLMGTVFVVRAAEWLDARRSAMEAEREEEYDY